MSVSSYERACVGLGREFASCSQARPVKPGAHRSNRNLERGGDLLVAQLCKRVEEQRVPLTRTHCSEGARELSIES